MTARACRAACPAGRRWRRPTLLSKRNTSANTPTNARAALACGARACARKPAAKMRQLRSRLWERPFITRRALTAEGCIIWKDAPSSGRAQPASNVTRCDRPEPSHVVADHSRRAQQTATRTQSLNATACILQSRSEGRSEARVRCGPGCTSCACHNATLSLLPRVLPFAGARPEWDNYLAGVYGALPPFPFRLDSLKWFYRCDCRLLDRNCRVSNAACNVPATIAEWQERTRVNQIELQKAWPKLGVAARGAIDWRHERWRDSCRAGARVPLPDVLPKVWLGSLPSVRDGAVATREAFVGFKTNKWANPEFWLAPWGFWAGPFRDAPPCLASHSWVEVMRVLQPAETDYRSTFYCACACFEHAAVSIGSHLALVGKQTTLPGRESTSTSAGRCAAGMRSTTTRSSSTQCTQELRAGSAVATPRLIATFWQPGHLGTRLTEPGHGHHGSGKWPAARSCVGRSILSSGNLTRATCSRSRRLGTTARRRPQRRRRPAASGCAPVGAQSVLATATRASSC